MGQGVQTVPVNPTLLQVLPPLPFTGSASRQSPILGAQQSHDLIPRGPQFMGSQRVGQELYRWVILKSITLRTGSVFNANSKNSTVLVIHY